jgi:hypothetical protein
MLLSISPSLTDIDDRFQVSLISYSSRSRDNLESRERLKIPANVIDQLINGAQSDIRQVVWKLSNDTMNFNEGKALYVIRVLRIRNISAGQERMEICGDDPFQHYK